MTCELEDLEDDDCIHCGHVHASYDGSTFCDAPSCGEPACCNCTCGNYEKKGDMVTLCSLCPPHNAHTAVCNMPLADDRDQFLEANLCQCEGG